MRLAVGKATVHTIIYEGKVVQTWSHRTGAGVGEEGEGQLGWGEQFGNLCNRIKSSIYIGINSLHVSVKYHL